MWYFVCDYYENIVAWMWCANVRLGRSRATRLYGFVTLEPMGRKTQEAINELSKELYK